MSDKNLEQLIASLKSEAIGSAEQEAGKVMSDAKQKARDIIENAMKEKESIIASAHKEAADIQEKGKIVLQQAARDLTISVRNDLMNLFKAALETEVKSEFKGDLVKIVILSVVESIGKGVEVTLPANTYKELADFAQNKVQNTDGITFTESSSMLNGMKITKTAEGWSYEVSPETITEALLPFLTGNWIDILKGGQS